jgi:hypothetical protein
MNYSFFIHLNLITFIFNKTVAGRKKSSCHTNIGADLSVRVLIIKSLLCHIPCHRSVSQLDTDSDVITDGGPKLPCTSAVTDRLLDSRIN